MVAASVKYLYERLGAETFQQLVSALLSSQFPRFQAMPLGQADGGRDGLAQVGSKTLIYQVKFSVAGHEKDPVAWLSSILEGEVSNLRRLSDAGVRNYCIITNLCGTGRASLGTIDRMNAKLREYAQETGFDVMDCYWRDTVNSWVDNAPDSLKWTYADMLAGFDLIRYLVYSKDSNHERRLKNIVHKIASYESDIDRKVKFSQAQIDRSSLNDLFIDVSATRISTPSGFDAIRYSNDIGGAAKYLLQGHCQPYVLIRGVPGQGKSTLAQFICQYYRTKFLKKDESVETRSNYELVYFPVRVDLSTYAKWLNGYGISKYDTPNMPRRKKSNKEISSSIECFLAAFFNYESGLTDITAEDVQDMLNRLPCLLVFDGLDEVGNNSMRNIVVERINQFATRKKSYSCPHRIMVTTRPSAGQLAEPADDTFEVISLNPLTNKQQNDYLQKWCQARGIDSDEKEDLISSFWEKSKEPYISELAGNPMQLTILLDLLHEQGSATPTQRTELYDKYVGLLLARESNKNPAVVRKHREDLLEIIPFLGWYIQAHAEESPNNERMSTGEIKDAMRRFERTYGNKESMVDELFKGVTDRLWTLTSKESGTFEFEIQSLREYFAARYLYNNAGEDDRNFDSVDVLKELMRRPFWLNTVRFYGGNAQGGHIRMILDGVKEEMRANPSSSSIVAAWTLLTDGIFQRRPDGTRELINSICIPGNAEVLLDALNSRDIIALPNYTCQLLSSDSDPTWSRTVQLISQAPDSPDAITLARMLQDLLGQRKRFARWWASSLNNARNDIEIRRWLTLGANCNAADGEMIRLNEQLLHNAGIAELVLASGITTDRDSSFEEQLIDCVVNGDCINVTDLHSYPAQIAVALNPESFIPSDYGDFSEQNYVLNENRRKALNLLNRRNSPFAQIAKLRKFQKGQQNSTFPWANVAGALYKQYGRCLLSSEIAIIGAASRYAMGVNTHEGTTAFGDTAHPETMMQQTRQHRSDSDWWTKQIAFVQNGGATSQAEWLLAIYGIASMNVLHAHWERWVSMYNALPERTRYSVAQFIDVMEQHSRVKHMQEFQKQYHEDFPLFPATATKVLEENTPLFQRSEAVTTIPAQEPLLSVARKNHWLKVDEGGFYR